MAIIFPVPIAGMIAFLGSVDPLEFRGQVGLLKALYNRGQVALSILCGSAVFHALSSVDEVWYLVLPGLLLATIVAYATNTLIVAVQASLSTHVALHKVLAKMHGARPIEFLLSYIGLGLFGSATVWRTLALAPFVLAGCWVGLHTARRLSQTRFDQLVLAATVVSALALVVR